MKKTILVFCIIIVLCRFAEASEPEVLAEFFGHRGISHKSTVYHGEMLEQYANQPTLGESLPKDVQATFRKLDETKNNAIYAVLLSDGRQTQDWYAFLVRENKIWKLSTVRTLALTGVFHMALQQLKQKAFRTDDEEWQYQNMLLTNKSDSDLKAYLKNKLVEFKYVVELLSKGDKKLSEIEAKKLFVNKVKNNDGLVELNIGGIIDNTVGYLYVPPGKNPPAMSPSEFIYIEQITDGWYIYKTT